MNLNGTVTNPGELRTPITLQSRSVSEGAGGFETEGWVTIAAVYSKWVNVHGSEAWVAATNNALEAATVTIRYRDDVDLTCAVLLGSERYEIVSIDNVRHRNEYLELKLQRMTEA
jgi:head-tail adaptor